MVEDVKKNSICITGMHPVIGRSDSDYIEVTEWANGEGVDIDIMNSGNSKHISLHHDELQAVQYAVLELIYGFNKKNSQNQ